jgi:hypothetical protein
MFDFNIYEQNKSDPSNTTPMYRIHLFVLFSGISYRCVNINLQWLQFLGHENK